MSFNLRDAEDTDLEIIQELSVKLSEKEAEEFDSTIDPQWNTSEEATEYFETRITEEDGFAVVAEEDERIVGYIVGGLRNAEEYRNELDIAELETMYVEPGHRSQGIGTRFVDRFESWAEEHNADRMRVEVTSQNEDGIRFYERNGLQDYAQIMEKEL